MVRCRQDGLADDLKAIFAFDNIHPNVDVGNEEAPREALQGCTFREGIDTPNDDVAVAKPFNLARPFGTNSTN